MSDMEVDVIISGTGLTGSVVAACLAYRGYKVLQIDRYQCYGLSNRTVSVKQLLESPDAQCVNSCDSLQQQYVRLMQQDATATEASVVTQGLTKVETNHVLSNKVTADSIYNASHPRSASFSCVESATQPRSYSFMTPSKRLKEYLELMYQNKDDTPQLLFELAPFATGDTEAIQAMDHLCANSNKYALDSWPKMIFGYSAVVDILLNSGGHSYIHFTDTSGPVLYGTEPEDGGDILLNEVPNSRNAICKSQLLSPLEKRSLMQLLMTITSGHCVPQFASMSLKGSEATASKNDTTEQCEDSGVNWLQYLYSSGCTKNIVDILSYGIGLGGADVPTWTKKEGVQRLLKYAQSIGVYGQTNSPFIYPMYGSGDIVQAFSRVGAVLGVTFILGTSVASAELVDNAISKVRLTNGMTVSTKAVIVEDTMTAGDCAKLANMNTTPRNRGSAQLPRRLHVLAFVIDEPILQGLTLSVIIPAESVKRDINCQHVVEPVYLIQAGADAGATPENKYLLYLMTIDQSPHAVFDKLLTCKHATVQRLLRIFNNIARQKGHAIEKTVLALYTSHDLENNVESDTLDMHRGWLKKDSDSKNREGNGIMMLPKARGTPVVPLLEEIPTAIGVVTTLLDNADVRPTAYEDHGLAGYIHVARAEDPENSATDATAEKLQFIIDKYG
ncbi:rab s geranylgeranyltransferase component A 1 [Babesia ovis]|uniref:Rab s geranylgeranyltransferase component A 1 n=1 Tax=Babesia ovis TaxID=5869 RepID=A0A9W5WTL8_BABOV|nr:rab s geranylgeranyltransferase component A 1 [Babesia ovis]